VNLPLWRSLLFVPVNVERFVAAAASRGADGIQLDLEDSVAASEKAAARDRVAAAASSLAAQGVQVIVRINGPWTLGLRDLEAAVSPSVAAITLPKVPSADHVRMVAETIDQLESERGMVRGSTRLIALIETAAAVQRLAEIAAAHPRLAAITLGTEDLSADLGIEPQSPAYESLSAGLVVAARAAGILPMGLVGSIAQFSDPDSFRRLARRSREFGLTGSSCIHPSQVPILNEEFSPGEREVERARAIVQAYDAALERGSGAIAVDGNMIDVPVAERARALLARLAIIESKRKDRNFD
jgi:citrate lyase subunit beta/citryl-CoA lyase